MLKTVLIGVIFVFLIGIIRSQDVYPEWWQTRINQGHLLSAFEEPQSELMPSVGNGYVSYVIGSDSIYIGGVFNGPASSLENPSHRAQIPNFQNITLLSGAELEYAGLDIENATYTRVYTFGSGSSTTATVVYYAHQSIRNVLVQEITIDNTLNTQDFQLDLESAPVDSIDFTIDTLDQSDQTTQYNLTILTPELGNLFVSVGVTTSTIPPSLSVESGNSKTFYFLTSLVTSLETEQFYIETSMDIYKISWNIQDSLEKSHRDAWKKIWDSRIEVGGNLDLAQVVNSSLYYIVSSVRDDWPWSLSPGSLSSNGYHGHVFWDSETWMYPSILTLYPKTARDGILQYRINHLEGAQEKAESYGVGYQGYMFPWESAFTGTEVCPTVAPTGLLEQHITGDISFAMRQYFYLTGDLKWLKTTAYPAIKGMAEFWASRVTNETVPDSYNPVFSINIVIPPDEYAVGVNNSVYTNVIAKMALEWGVEAASLVGDKTAPVEQWNEISNGLIVLFNETSQMHPEYEGYQGETIKQADVILLGYPLMYNMSTEVRSNDLIYYQTKTDIVNGPAMTWAMFVVGWLELGQPQEASKLWPQSYSNAQQPFNVWTETPTGGTVNFITGAGGFLQGVINGYGGLRIHSTYLDFNPQLPINTTSLKLRGVHYQSAKLDIYWTSQIMQIELSSNKDQLDFVLTTSNGTPQYLKEKVTLTLPVGTFTIEAISSSTHKKHKLLINY
ncbi:acid trehalase-like protein 1 [Tieghemostelium lacteum]|uniref:Protein-glucosylgalactosylhydroxylysine glucosidase n=1 Tax=Tieghemostelium lacteum TaxID=361077 RepID=A0A151ZB38_TIELA|nr:acid trehalase-like protein 1 [Tieghemostelium lacteum]|eukprot:KYQ91148.1 acid trehalase-like protein 1 [Tieghemostelium lacteum]